MTATKITANHLRAASILIDEAYQAMAVAERATARKFTEGRLAELQEQLDLLCCHDAGQLRLAQEAGIDAHAIRDAAFDAITDLVAAWRPASI